VAERSDIAVGDRGDRQARAATRGDGRRPRARTSDGAGLGSARRHRHFAGRRDRGATDRQSTRRTIVAPALAARIPPHGPASTIASEAIGTIPEAFSTTALAAADAVRDVARHARAMEHLAYRDPLTGLWNRRTCDDRLLALTEGDSQDAVLVLDVDRFKTINDTFGHEAGDEALIRVANTIAASIRPSDFAARFGGDEFMILLPSTTAEHARGVAERIRATVQQERRDPPVTVSIGVADVSGSSLTTRLAADRALYLAKEAGRNQIAATLE
jgi:diguanylate cyclase (GGDEF)-like protein